MMGELPALDGTQGDRQAGGFSKSFFVFLKDFGTAQSLDQAAVAVAMAGGLGLEQRGPSTGVERLGASRGVERGRCGGGSIKRTSSVGSLPNICCLHEAKLGVIFGDDN